MYSSVQTRTNQSRSNHVGREVAVPVLRPVPEAAVTVSSTPDDGRCDTRNT